jgi:hypothetical protein
MKLTNQDLDILVELLMEKLKEIELGSESTEIYHRSEVYINVIKKLESIYFS